MLSLDILDLWVYLGLCAWHLANFCSEKVERVAPKGGKKATLLDGAHGAFFAGTAEKPIQIPHFGPFLSMFSKHTLQVQYTRLNWGAVPPIYLITVHTISEIVRAPFQVPLPVFLKSSDFLESVSPHFFVEARILLHRHGLVSTTVVTLGTWNPCQVLECAANDFGNLSMGIGGS